MVDDAARLRDVDEIFDQLIVDEISWQVAEEMFRARHHDEAHIAFYRETYLKRRELSQNPHLTPIQRINRLILFASEYIRTHPMPENK